MVVDTGCRRSGFTRERAGPAGQISTRDSPLPPPPYSRVNPRLHADRWWTQAVVGAGSPAKGPALLANCHAPFTVAAATVFAGKPAPTRRSVVDTGRRRSGFTRERAGPAGQISTRYSPLPPPPYSRVNPLLHRSVVDTGRRRSGFTRERAGPAGQIFTRDSPLPPPPYLRVNPPRLHTDRWWTQAVVGAGSPAKGPALLAKFPLAIHRCRRHRIRG
ncbi:hypothetical protein J3A98_001004 [Pseudomonas sp. BP6]|nr:hypothetical protein [Pseudomonas sp. BP6]MBP2285406.1 hypothetical protein [Pseudomonas sp. BP7]